MEARQLKSIDQAIGGIFCPAQRGGPRLGGRLEIALGERYARDGPRPPCPLGLLLRQPIVVGARRREVTA